MGYFDDQEDRWLHSLPGGVKPNRQGRRVMADAKDDALVRAVSVIRQRDERIAALESENERLRERVNYVEAHCDKVEGQIGCARVHENRAKANLAALRKAVEKAARELDVRSAGYAARAWDTLDAALAAFDGGE